ncbi:MAG: hypothetical protein U1C55_03320 [Smithellaceae bacterium]|nr:hypothetical protein [Smithellaceae bacterium]
MNKSHDRVMCILKYSALISLIFLVACAELRIHTLPVPPATAKLRVYVLPVTETGRWKTPADVFEKYTIKLQVDRADIE